MQRLETKISDLILLEIPRYQDDRGYFEENYHQQKYAEIGIDEQFVQDNLSLSKRGVLRGLHFQIPPFAQSKLVKVSLGEVLDVVVDIRHDSPTYGQYESFILSNQNNRQLYIPVGFAHGFLVLSDQAIFEYKVGNYYSKYHEMGIMWDDPDLAIDWQTNDVIISPKDLELKNFKDLQNFNW